jgi:hypothetical protein
MMKQTKIFLLTMILFYLSLSSLFPMMSHAQNAGVSITSVNAVLLQTKTLGNREIHYYKLIVILHNYGSAPSDQISVKFYDPEYNASTTPPMVLSPANYSLLPDENKVFNFSEWPTSLTGDVPLNISFSPTTQNAQVNPYNTGYYLYTLHIGGGKTTSSTPGFEFVVFLIAFALLIVWRNRNK